MKFYRLCTIVFMVFILTACASESAQQGPGGERGGRAGGQQGGQPDLSGAAATLGVSEEALGQALREAGGPPPDMEKAAAALGIDVADLEAALPRRPQRRR